MHSVLTINGGSSSIKFALYEEDGPLERRLYGKIDRIGLSGTHLTFNDATGNQQDSRSFAASDHKSAAEFLIDWLEEQNSFESVWAVGHRVVHGMKHTAPERVTQELLDELHRISPYDPEHLPREIELIEAFRQRHPKLPQVACFDTAFHRSMPRVARLLAIPRRFDAKGIQRYGFHGLSYAYLMEELARLGDPTASKGRVILAHLGNGACMAAVRDGKSIDTSMGFTPAAGLPMSTRSGDLDPGLVSCLARTEQMTATQFHQMVNHESGLLGVSEISSDMRDLLAQETAHRAMQNCGQVFRYAVATGRVERDPTGDLRGALPPPKEKHHASIIEPKRIAGLLRAIDAYEGFFATKCALRLAPLVFVRPGELRKAQWPEIDFDKAEWRIPAERMKMREQHIVPLSHQAIEILRELEPLTNRGIPAKPDAPRYVFPGAQSRERPMSENAILAALRRMGYPKEEMTGHGFRSMASTLLHEQGWNHQAIERQLAHAERNAVSAAYNFAEHLPERRKMMQAWADYLDALKAGAEVIPLFKKA